jgi:hypothetical protein
VDFFGANGSALATYDAMFHSVNKDKENFKLEPLCDLLDRIQMMYVPMLGDKVTLVMFKISGFIVKIWNVVLFYIIFLLVW